MPNPAFRTLSRCLVLVLAATLLPGCGTPRRLTAEQLSALGRIAVVQPGQAPEVGLGSVAHGAWEGAGKGAASTLGGCMSASGGGQASVLVLLWWAGCVVAAPVGAAVGAARAPSAEAASADEQVLRGSIDAAALQYALQEQVVAAGLRHGLSLAIRDPASGDSQLEAALTRIGLNGYGANPDLQVVMRAHVRLTRAADGQLLLERDFDFEGSQLKLSEWAQGGGERLKRELQDGAAAIGARIIEQAMLPPSR